MPKLAILGASYLQKPLVEKANSMGIETHCFAWNSKGSICKDIAYRFYPISVLEKEAVLEKCREIDVDGIVTAATDVSVPTMSFISNSMGLTGNSIESGCISTNKSRMKEAFISYDIKTPKSITVKKFKRGDFSGLNFPLISKPVDRSGSRGINKVYDFVQLEKAIRISLQESLRNEAIIEEYIEGSEVSVESISWKGKHYILSLTDKITTGEPHFVEVEHHQPSQLNKQIQARIGKETKKCLDALQIENGAAHSEFKIDKRGEIFAIETGARMGGDFVGSDLVHLSTGYDYLKGTIKAALGEFTEPVLSGNNFAGVFFLCKETDHLLPVIRNYHNYPQILTAQIMNEELKQVQSSGDRSGYFIYQSGEKFSGYSKIASGTV